MALQLSTSAALLFTEQELGGPCTEQESYPICSVNGTILCQGNGDRVGLIIMNLSGQAVNISLAGVVTANTGILLPANGGFVTMSVRDDFTLQTRQWTGIATGGPAQIYVLEIVRYTSNELS